MAITKIRVAIIGGGLAGCILMNALTKHPQLDVHLFEARPEMIERGASIGIQPNAQRALRLLGLDGLGKKAGRVNAGCFRMVVGEGPDLGKTIVELPTEALSMHRAALLNELLSSISKEKLHLNKTLSSIHDITIQFADGTTFVADVIIGADGIHSSVRKYVLPEGHAAVEPVHAGFWDGRAIASLDEAATKLGTDNIDRNNPRQQMYFGDGRMLYQDVIDDAQRICIVAGGIMPPDWDRTKWKHTVTRAWLEEQFKGFGDFGKNVLELFCEQKDEVTVFAEWESAEAPKLCNRDGTICMIGDAAHAMTPWQACGLAQAIEDSLILESVLGLCSNAQDVPAALEAFDRIMRPRGQLALASSREAGMVMCGANGLDAEKLRADLPPRWDALFNWDTEGAIKQAVSNFEQIKTQVYQ